VNDKNITAPLLTPENLMNALLDAASSSDPILDHSAKTE
jgi:hypothetical protein